MTSTKFPEVCQEISEAFFFQETPDLAAWEEETFYFGEFLEPSFQEGSAEDSQLLSAFTEHCALKVALDGELFGDLRSPIVAKRRLHIDIGLGQ